MDPPLKYLLQETSARDWSKSGPNVGLGPQNKVQQQANAKGRFFVAAGNMLDHWDHNLHYHNCCVDHLVPNIHSILALATAHGVDFTMAQDVVQEQWAASLDRNCGILGRVRVLKKGMELASMEGRWAPNLSPSQQTRWWHAIIPNWCLTRTIAILTLLPH
jgi:hypothetical protein